MTDLRPILLERLRSDLVGPTVPAPRAPAGASGDHEVLTVRPSDRYVTGILFPDDSDDLAEEDDTLGTQVSSKDDVTGGEAEAVPFGAIQRPRSIGISFAVRGDNPSVVATFTAGRYILRDEHGSAPETEKLKRASERWHREPVVAREAIALRPGHAEPLPTGVEGIELYVRCVDAGDGTLLVTIAATNKLRAARDKISTCAASFFQTEITVEPGPGVAFTGRPSRRSVDPDDDDALSMQLVYRSSIEFATGHTCSADWDRDGERVTRVRTAWLPRVTVPGTSADGDDVFDALRTHPQWKPFSARWLSEASVTDCVAALEMLPSAYASWLDAEEKRIAGDVPAAHHATAHGHLGVCRTAVRRMRGAIGLLATDEKVFTAFRLANAAMYLQRTWGGDLDLVWRPFQLGFQLLSLESLAGRAHPDRGVVDLLWFPTGGGKTEAYLALIAFTAFLRRVRGTAADDYGAGVAALMRYTLRLLTVQQFQRAAKLVCACEWIRLGNVRPDGTSAIPLGSAPFSIGLWVGSDATPQYVADAQKSLAEDSEPSPKQLTECPRCKGELRWSVVATRGMLNTACACTSQRCELASLRELPVYTVDEDVYRVRPTLLIGTIDKFAQIARSPDRTEVLFGVDGPPAPPDLVIQDELHLISGPLGTVAGIYEAAIEALSGRLGRPKVIGSTATIRRASAQIEQLFDRRSFQFPPPVIDAGNSCFAVVDHDAPGRVYLGLTTAGRSAKLMLGAIAASLLQSTADPRVGGAHADYYSTLVAYFNTLRELGGAVVLMQDDVAANITDFASRRGEAPRAVEPPEELTSRRKSKEIPEILSNLEKAPGSGGYDVMLASNMISVGVDVPRLGLMTVHGQPKTISEYIQATSRVGRNRVPGLVVVLYNASKARDRSHFESFRTWHETLYRDVEATSVTPYAPRARERALHAALVASIRHLLVAMRTNPAAIARHRSQCNAIADQLYQRALRLDPDEANAVRTRLSALLDQWQARARDLREYWKDRVATPAETLMMSAERVATYRAVHGTSPAEVWPTLNSMREVEPATKFVVVNRLRDRGAAAAGSDEGGDAS